MEPKPEQIIDWLENSSEDGSWPMYRHAATLIRALQARIEELETELDRERWNRISDVPPAGGD